MHLLSKILQVVLRYEIFPGGSRSHIRDHLPEKYTYSTSTYPLYWRGVNINKFKFAMRLMEHNINHLLIHCNIQSFQSSDHMLFKLSILFNHLLGTGGKW